MRAAATSVSDHSVGNSGLANCGTAASGAPGDKICGALLCAAGAGPGPAIVSASARTCSMGVSACSSVAVVDSEPVVGADLAATDSAGFTLGAGLIDRPAIKNNVTAPR